jgi:hypothetical protein
MDEKIKIAENAWQFNQRNLDTYNLEFLDQDEFKEPEPPAPRPVKKPPTCILQRMTLNTASSANPKPTSVANLDDFEAKMNDLTE